jgi:hypothetical protein
MGEYLFIPKNIYLFFVFIIPVFLYFLKLFRFFYFFFFFTIILLFCLLKGQGYYRNIKNLGEKYKKIS